MAKKETSPTTTAPRSIRLTGGTYDALNARRYETKADSLEDVIAELLKAASLDAAAEVVPGRKEDIAAYERSLKSLLDLFLHSLALKDEVVADAKAEVQKELSEKDSTIQTLQASLQDAQKAVAELKEQLAVAEAARAKAEARAAENCSHQMLELMVSIKGTLDKTLASSPAPAAAPKQLDTAGNQMTLDDLSKGFGAKEGGDTVDST